MTHIVRDRNVWRYWRFVPKPMRAAVGRTAWTKTFTKDVSRAEAEAVGRALDEVNDALIARLRGLDPADIANVEFLGGAADIDAAVVKAATVEFMRRRFGHVTNLRQPVPTMTTVSEALAVSVGAPALAELQTRLYEPAGSMVEPLIADWLRIKGVTRPLTIKQYRAIVTGFVDVVGDMPIDRVSADHAAQYRDALSGHKQAGKYIGILRYLFKLQISERHIKVNPFADILANATTKNPPKIPLMPHDLRRLLPILRAGDKLAIRVIVHSGMRACEAVDLRGRDLRLEGGVLVFDVIDSKTISGIRTVPVHSAIKAEVLAAQKASGSDGQLIPVGKLMSLRERVREALRGLGVPPTVTLHSCRRTFRWCTAQAGLDVQDVQYIQGWSTGGDMTAHYNYRPSMKKLARLIETVRPMNDEGV